MIQFFTHLGAAIIGGIIVWLITTGKLRFWWLKGRYVSVRKKVENYINFTAESINREIGFPVLTRVKVEIVSAKDVPAELGENEVIVRLRPNQSPYNTAYVLRDVLEEGL
mgnify:CR=1 FL=1